MKPSELKLKIYELMVEVEKMGCHTELTKCVVALGDARIAAENLEKISCQKCGQFDTSVTGEYNCSECGLPMIHDEVKNN